MHRINRRLRKLHLSPRPPGASRARRPHEGGGVPLLVRHCATPGASSRPSARPAGRREPARGGRARRPRGASAALTRDWHELALRLDGSSYFQSPDWVLAWWETVARRPPTRIAAWRAPAGRLEALVALSEDRARLHGALPVDLPVQVNAGSGPGAADHCGWLVPADRRAEVAAWLGEALGGAGLLLRGADPAWGRPPLPPRARVIAVTTCPRLTLPGPDEARRAIARAAPPAPALHAPPRARGGALRVGARPGRSTSRCCARCSRCTAGLRAGRAGGTSFGPEQLALHLRLAASAAARAAGPPRSSRAATGAVAGVLYGFWWKDAFAAYQWGWDPAWARFSMGSVLTYQAIRFAAAAGARTLDLLRGTEPYKYRFGAVDRHDRTWIVPRGPAGLLLSARYRARDRIRPRRRPEPFALARSGRRRSGRVPSSPITTHPSGVACARSSSATVVRSASRLVCCGRTTTSRASTWPAMGRASPTSPSGALSMTT